MRSSGRVAQRDVRDGRAGQRDQLVGREVEHRVRVPRCGPQAREFEQVRVDRIQARSRRVARLKLTDNGLITRVRDEAIRIMVDEPLLDTVDAVMAERV